FQGWRHRQTDGLFGAAGVRHHQIGGQRVQAPGGALRRGIVAFQVDGKIGARAGHGGLPPLSKFYAVTVFSTNHRPTRPMNCGPMCSKKRRRSRPWIRTVKQSPALSLPTAPAGRKSRTASMAKVRPSAQVMDRGTMEPVVSNSDVTLT